MNKLPLGVQMADGLMRQSLFRKALYYIKSKKYLMTCEQFNQLEHAAVMIQLEPTDEGAEEACNKIISYLNNLS